MGIFDKGFDPLKEIQKVSKTAGEVVTRIAEGASGMTVAAGAAIVDATTTAGAAIVGAAVAGAASNAKAVVNKITATCRKRKVAQGGVKAVYGIGVDSDSYHVYDEDKYEYSARFDSEEAAARLEVRADKIEIVLDCFGEGVELSKVDDETAKAFVKVRKSEQFFGRIAGMGNKVKIARPKSLVDEYKSYLKELLES